jgi:hypothetical protein
MEIDGDGGPAFRQPQGNTAPDPARRACDQREFSA